MADNEEKTSETTPQPAEQAEQPTPASPQQAANEAADAFKQGLGLLWKAARGAADEIKREVEKGGVTDALKQAGHDLETAASHAAKAVEGFVERVGPADAKWADDLKSAGFPGGNKPKQDDTKQPSDKQVDADVPEDGGIDEETGERRDMRIQVEDDES